MKCFCSQLIEVDEKLITDLLNTINTGDIQRYTNILHALWNEYENFTKDSKILIDGIISSVKNIMEPEHPPAPQPPK